MASECANNALTGGSMTIPLSLGIPGSNTTAMLAAAFIIHGLQPGPLLLTQRLDIVYGIFVAMLLANIFLLGLTIGGIRLFLQLNRLPYSVFSAAIMILCAIGAFGISNSMDEPYLMFAVGVIGYFMQKYGHPVAPAVLGLVLGDPAELWLRRSLLLSFGNPLIPAHQRNSAGGRFDPLHFDSRLRFCRFRKQPGVLNTRPFPVDLRSGPLYVENIRLPGKGNLSEANDG